MTFKEIVTKYGICDTVWFMKDDIPVHSKVIGIEVKQAYGKIAKYYWSTVNDLQAIILYRVEHQERLYAEQQLFSTKEELRDYLFKN